MNFYNFLIFSIRSIKNLDIINQHLRENISNIERLRKEISTKTNENENLQLQLKLTTQEIDCLKKLKDVSIPKEIKEAPHTKNNEEEEKKVNNNDSLFGKSVLGALGVSSIHEIQSFLEVFYILFIYYKEFIRMTLGIKREKAMGRLCKKL